MQQLTTVEFERYPKTTLVSGACRRDGGDAAAGVVAGSTLIVAQRPARCGSERAKDESRQLIRGKVPIEGGRPASEARRRYVSGPPGIRICARKYRDFAMYPSRSPDPGVVSEYLLGGELRAVIFREESIALQ